MTFELELELACQGVLLGEETRDARLLVREHAELPLLLHKGWMELSTPVCLYPSICLAD